jgi:single-strand DNA-binding protein
MTRSKASWHYSDTPFHSVIACGAWRNLSRFAKTLQKGQLISVDGQIRYCEYAEEVNGITVKHRVAEIHAYKLQRLSKIAGQGESADESAEE